MIKIDQTLIFYVINLILLYVLLKKLLFKPVTEFMENRTKKIQSQLDNASTKEKEADNLKSEYENLLHSAHSQSAQILEKARAQAGEEADAIIIKAKQEAEGIIQKAQQSMEEQKKQMIKDIQNQVITLAFSAASKILQKNIDSEANKKIIEDFLKEVGVA